MLIKQPKINEPPGQIGMIGHRSEDIGGDRCLGNYEKGLVSLFNDLRVQPCASEKWVLVGPSRLW